MHRRLTASSDHSHSLLFYCGSKTRLSNSASGNPFTTAADSIMYMLGVCLGHLHSSLPQQQVVWFTIWL